MVFYLDLILLLNFVIDYFILLATSKYLNLTIKRYRLIIAALIGALYTLVFFIPSLSFLELVFSKILLSGLMILIAFGFIHLYHFIQTVATFYVVSFLTGGGVFAIQYLFNVKHDVINGIYVSRSSSPMMVITIIVIGFFVILLMSKRTYSSLQRKSNVTSKLVDIELSINGNLYACKGLIDTGNQLYDPISRKPVLVIEAEKLEFLPAPIKAAYKNQQFDLGLFEKVSEQIEPEWLSKIQLVPFRSVSRGMQFILTVRPDKVVIITEQDTRYTQTRVLVGLDYGQLSADQSYQAIVHPELIAS